MGFIMNESYSAEGPKELFFSHTVHWENPLDLFGAYKKYFQESIWLFIQQLFAKLCIKYEPNCKDIIQKAVAFQQKEFHKGKQLHLGEILLRKNILSEKQLHFILEKMGVGFFFCALCKQHYHYYPFNITKIPRCVCCSGRLTRPIPNKKILLQYFRCDYNVLFPFSKKAEVPHGKFVFISPQEYVGKSMQYMENEITSVFRSLHRWILQDSTLSTPTTQDQATSDTTKMRALNEKFFMFFLGYLQNLEELYWLLSEMMFRQLAKHPNLQDALDIQEYAFSQNKQFHLAEALVESGSMDVENTYKIVSQVSHSIYTCTSCNNLFAKVFQERSGDLCPHCGGTVKECQNLDKETIVQSLRINFLHPFILSQKNLLQQTEFTFFQLKENESYSDIMFSQEYIQNALAKFSSQATIDDILVEDVNDFGILGKSTEFQALRTKEIPLHIPSSSPSHSPSYNEQLLYSHNAISSSSHDEFEIVDVSPEQAEIFWESQSQFQTKPDPEKLEALKSELENLEIADTSIEDSDSNFWNSEINILKEQLVTTNWNVDNIPSPSSNVPPLDQQEEQSIVPLDEDSAELEIIDIDEEEFSQTDKSQEESMQQEPERLLKDSDFIHYTPRQDSSTGTESDLLRKDNTPVATPTVSSPPADTPSQPEFVDLRSDSLIDMWEPVAEKTQILTIEAQRAQQRKMRRNKRKINHEFWIFIITCILVAAIIIIMSI